MVEVKIEMSLVLFLICGYFLLITGEMNAELGLENNFPVILEQITTLNEGLIGEKRLNEDDQQRQQQIFPQQQENQNSKDETDVNLNPELEDKVKLLDSNIGQNGLINDMNIGVVKRNGNIGVAEEIPLQINMKKKNSNENESFVTDSSSISSSSEKQINDDHDYIEHEFNGEDLDKEINHEIQDHENVEDAGGGKDEDGNLIKMGGEHQNETRVSRVKNETENEIPKDKIVYTLMQKGVVNVTSEGKFYSDFFSTLLPMEKPVDSNEVVPLRGSTVEFPTTKTSLKFFPQPSSYVVVVLNLPWSTVCTNEARLRSTIAAQLSTLTERLIQPSHVILLGSGDRWPHHLGQLGGASGLCELEVKNDFDSNPVIVMAYVDGSSGQADRRLTMVMGKALIHNDIKMMDSIFKNVILEVHLFPKDEQHHTIISKDDTNSVVNNNMGIIAAFTISSIAGTTLILLCILLLILRHRHHKFQETKKCRAIFDTYSLDSISIYSSIRPKKNSISKHSYLNLGFTDPCAPSHQINFAGLANLCLEQEKNAMEEEFKSIPTNKNKLKQSSHDSRFTFLQKKGDLHSNSCINANLIRDKMTSYVACRAPMEKTVTDFWTMIWEQQIKVIVMLNQFEENGEKKCANYFPTSELDCHLLFGDFQITLKKKETLKSYKISNLQIRNLEKNLVRDLTHFSFTGWPSAENEIPDDINGILALLLEVRPLTINSGPMTVHCSESGRAGTTIVIDMCMRQFELTRTVDIANCVYLVRQQCEGAVSTVQQYSLIYKVLNEYASHFSNLSHNSQSREGH